MRVAVVRRAPGASFSMDVYADGLVGGLRQVRPDWQILELTPDFREFQGSALDRLGKYYRRYGQWPRRVRRQPVDLFHIVDHSDGHLCYSLGHPGRRPRVPVVITCHDLINYIQPENISTQALLPQLSRWFWRYAVRGVPQADHIVTVSHHTEKDVIATFGLEPNQLTTAHNGVDPVFAPLPADRRAAVRQTMRSRYGLAPEAFCLLNVGSNHPRKNITAILQALALLRDQGQRVHLLKAGTGFTAAQTAYLKAEDLIDWVTEVGRPDREALVDLYNAADGLIAPSLYEGFGITPLEAMACGTPVVAAQATALPEVVGNAGLLVPPSNIGAIAAAITRLQDPATHQSLAAAGLEQARGFTWAAHAERVAAVYESLPTPSL
jgi:glycosyltransferase involved in cell wall biosynthesis